MKSTDLLFATTLEGFRALSKAIESKENKINYLQKTKFNGIFENWNFDKNGEIEGLDFVIKKVVNGDTEEVE